MPGVVVAGKTGTADTGFTSASNSEPVSWFTGYAMQNGQHEDCRSLPLRSKTPMS